MTRPFQAFAASLVCAVSAGALAACATPEDQDREPEGAAAFADDPRLGEQRDRICFGSQINGFGQTTDRTIVVEAGVNDEYLIETFGACPDLDFAQSIRFDQFSSCVRRGDSLIPYDSPFGPDHTDIPPAPCRINAIYEWDSDAGEAAME